MLSASVESSLQWEGCVPLLCGGQVCGGDAGAPVFLWLCSFSPFLSFGGTWEETRREGKKLEVWKDKRCS